VRDSCVPPRAAAGPPFERSVAGRPRLLPRTPGLWIGVSKIAPKEEEIVGVLPTLLPTRRNAESVTNQEVVTYREDGWAVKDSNLRPWD
jgi:hypothetical protein